MPEHKRRAFRSRGQYSSENKKREEQNSFVKSSTTFNSCIYHNKTGTKKERLLKTAPEILIVKAWGLWGA